MEAQTQTAKKGIHKDVYGIITDRIIEQLEKGIVPWRKSWADTGVPTSLTSKRPYRGINFLLLAGLGYEQNYFLTSKQLKELGGSILPEEKPHIVVFRNYADKEPKETDGPEVEANGVKSSFLRYYTVYNVAQCVGIPEETLAGITVPMSPVAASAKILSEMPHFPIIKHKEPMPYYDPLVDVLNMPKKAVYESEEEYYAELFHQLVHSTGHHTRLDRMGLVQMSEYGCEPFTLEELIAEIGACYLQSLAAIPGGTKDDKEYAKGWIEKLKADRYFIFTAAASAQKAIDFILDVTVEDKTMQHED